MRVFLAIDLPEELKNQIYSYYKKVSKAVYGKFVEKENLHITLKFIGEVLDINPLIERLNYVKFKPFEVKVKGLSAFPSIENPRVVWVGAHSVYLNDLANQINRVLKSYENFVGHITIVRVKRVLDKKYLLELAKKFDLEYKFVVDRFYLYKSTLTPNGPIYEKLYEFKSIQD
ncbi:NEQ502 [Nanoarchaeum equitans Kin4-M]|uniref:RNA 2',3'-cyclic phosphodiesterase n=1 Tax=Nanoarchaeum equitans (strain Kin4-M) TaxID=228908 RepID=Q74MW1_NANEQ|nr:NEQ502 [Nanoarchaeum equitans Kin4-M]